MKPLLLVVLLCQLTYAAATTTLASLPDSSVAAVKTDAAGNIYVAGYQGLGTQSAADAFVAKLSPTGAVIYSTTFGGSNADYASRIDIDSSGAAYIIGTTASTDFPVTPGALQTTFQAPEIQGFVVKVDPKGKVVYATYIGGSSDINLGFSGIAVDSAGDAILSGQTIGGVFPATPGAPFTSTDTNTFFVMKVDPTGGKLLAAIRGVGGRIALDAQGNVYIAGVQLNTPTSSPITPGAFQSTFSGHACGGTGQMGFSCDYQYVTKLTASLTQIVYSTYLDGSFGATPAAVSVDAQGNAFVAGTTNSPDYPTTPDAFEPTYIANAPAPPQTCLFGCVFPPPQSGYLTKLNATGTGLIYSTYYSGTQADAITFAAFTANGIYVAGSAGSPDLPGFEGFPLQCLSQTYAARLSADATEIGAARAAPGTVMAYDAAAGVLIAWTGATLVSFDPAAPPTPIGCILDAADLQPVTAIVPGELLTIFGQRLAAEVITQQPGSFATSLSGVGVTVNGIASPLLYVSPQQINVQAPFEIAGKAQATVALVSTQVNVSDSRTLPIGASNPIAFLNPTPPLTFAECRANGTTYVGGPIPLAFNADGSLNSCINAATAGSVVRIFLEALGATSPPQATGSIVPNPGPALNLPITFTGNFPAIVVAATALPYSISGVWEVDIRMPMNVTGAIPLTPVVGGAQVRDSNLTVWVKGQPQ